MDNISQALENLSGKTEVEHFVYCPMCDVKHINNTNCQRMN